MTFSVNPLFEHSIKKLGDPKRRERARVVVTEFANILESNLVLPPGIGLKKLRGSYWEIRAELKDRIVFTWSRDRIDFLLVGSHADIRHFLRR